MHTRQGVTAYTCARRMAHGPCIVGETALHQLFGVNYTVVSQVNPHVLPFFFENRGSGGSPTLHREGYGW
jgi:hypothetical protein